MSQHFKIDQMQILAERFAAGRITRRQLLGGLAALGVAAQFAPLGRGARAAASELIICNWGGVAVENFQKAFADPFTAATGVAAKVVGDGPATGKIRTMVEANNAIWDVCDTGIADTKALGEKYLEKIDYAVVSKDKVMPGFALDYGVSNYFFSNVLVYDSSKVSRPPTSWADFFDTKTFPGKRTMCKWLGAQLESALFGDGVTADKMYPLDVDRGFAKIKSILPDLVFWEGGAQSQQFFRDGEVVMGNLWHTRARLLRDESKGKFDWIWNQGVLQSSAWNIPKGNPAGAETANKFVAATQDPQQQIALLDLMANGPANPAADAAMNDDQRKISPTSPANAKVQLVIDTDWYGANEADVQNKYLDVIAS